MYSGVVFIIIPFPPHTQLIKKKIKKRLDLYWFLSVYSTIRDKEKNYEKENQRIHG